METWISVLAAFGVGSIITTYIQNRNTSRQAYYTMLFDERKEAFIGLLNAYRSTKIDKTPTNLADFTYWQIRCELVGSKALSDSIEQLVQSEPNSEERIRAEKQLKQAMKKDLGT